MASAMNSTGMPLNVTNPWRSCHEVSLYCPVQLTTLGYFPNKGVNIFLSAGFGIAAVVCLFFGVWKRTWSYMAFITAGCVLEMAGYISRIFLANNPWNQQAFQAQISTIVLAPTLVCISIYLTLKHTCRCLNPELSRIRPKLYPYIFVPADVSCLVIQAIGGGMAASGGDKNRKMTDAGNHMIIAGIALQVVVLGFFGLASLNYFLRVKKWMRSGEATTEARALWTDRKFRIFAYAVTGAYSAILIRCIYRIAEMAGGWGNKIMQDEPSFIVLESFMLLIAVLILACFPPGILFPAMSGSKQGAAGHTDSTVSTKKKNKGEISEGDQTDGPAEMGSSTGAQEEKVARKSKEEV